jgi:hypothetical protein
MRACAVDDGFWPALAENDPRIQPQSRLPERAKARAPRPEDGKHGAPMPDACPIIAVACRWLATLGMSFLVLGCGALVVTLLVVLEMRRQRTPWRSVVIRAAFVFAVLMATIVAWRGL